MKWFKNLKLATKLVSSFVIVSLMAGALGIYGLLNVKNINDDYTFLWEDYGLTLGDLGSAGIDFNTSRVYIYRIILNENEEEMREMYAEINQLNEQVKSHLNNYGATIQSDEAYRLFEQLNEAFEQYSVISDRVINLALANQNDQALDLLLSEGVPFAMEAGQLIDQLFELRKTNGNNISDDLDTTTSNLSVAMLAIIFVTMVVAIGLGIFISRIISVPVKNLVKSANQIADGNLNIAIDVQTKDEIGQLGQAFSMMSNNLNEIMSNIQAAAEQVASGSKQISESSMTLSHGATEQASSVEELTASIEEIASQTRRNADTANEANQLAETAKDNAVLGNNHMKEMLGAMDEINAASQNISKIIKVIEEIAFQTNILALNAAVEAARAGQHGKGFAVVAEEVRNLAARSANAAKETTELIEGSIKKADGGTRIANGTAVVLEQIVGDVVKIAKLVDDIAIASNEQAIGIGQINQGIMQVSQVVQANSATSEETAAASEELSSQAQVMNQQVGRFQLRKTKEVSYSSAGTLSPELMQLFEQMSEKKANQILEQSSRELPDTHSKKIDLSDRDFGKY